VQTSLRKWALRQKCRFSLRAWLRLPVTSIVTGINSGSGPWYSRSRAGHNCQQLCSLHFLWLSAYVTISCARQSFCCHVTPLHCFILCSSLFHPSVWFFAYPVCHHNSRIVITISHLTNMPTVVFPQIVLFACVPPFPLPPALAHPFILLLVFCCSAVHK
jgi:hypothetical protein